ncbi:MAG: hypothetical protein N2Z74_03675 [Syntrophales bacterium]|nr:hypothetical protein [Syntrophales bacterium]
MTATKTSFIQPLGFLITAITAIAFGALYLGKVTVDTYPIMACWLLAGGGGLLATVFLADKGDEQSDRIVFLVFGLFFMIAPALAMGVKYALMKAGLPYDSRIEGYNWLVVAAFFTLSLTVQARGHLLKLVFTALLTVALWLLGIVNIQLAMKETLAPVIGWLFMAAGLVGVYIAGALFTVGPDGKGVLPLPGPLVK